MFIRVPLLQDILRNWLVNFKLGNEKQTKCMIETWPSWWSFSTVVEYKSSVRLPSFSGNFYQESLVKPGYLNLKLPTRLSRNLNMFNEFTVKVQCNRAEIRHVTFTRLSR